MDKKRWLYKTIKGLENKMLFQNILCTFLGHKADKTALAYEIKNHDTLYEVKIYKYQNAHVVIRFMKNLLTGIRIMTGM